MTSVIDDRYGYRGAGVTVHLTDGTVLHEDFDVAIPESDLLIQEAKLTEKFHSLAEPVIGRVNATTVVDLVLSLEAQPNISPLIKALTG